MDTNEVQLNILIAHSQFITMKVHWKRMRMWCFTTVYASLAVEEREELWREIEAFIGSVDKPWMLAGDFNEAKNLEERDHGGDEMLHRCLRLNNVIENNGLIDLGFPSPKFTWARGLSLQTRKQARLDRALCNIEWRSRFQEVEVNTWLTVTWITIPS